MMRPFASRLAPARRALAAAGLALAAACAGKSSAASDPGNPRPNRNEITQQQILAQNFKNAFEAIQALRPNWLTVRGADSFRTPSQIWVYLDNSRLGGVDQLTAIAPSSIQAIRYFNGVEASARWGLDHGAGAIQIISRVR